VEVRRAAAIRHVVVVDSRAQSVAAVDRIRSGAGSRDEEVVLLARTWAVVEVQPANQPRAHHGREILPPLEEDAIRLVLSVIHAGIGAQVKRRV
jgi:hypothetical protein